MKYEIVWEDLQWNKTGIQIEMDDKQKKGHHVMWFLIFLFPFSNRFLLKCSKQKLIKLGEPIFPFLMKNKQKIRNKKRYEQTHNFYC